MNTGINREELLHQVHSSPTVGELVNLVGNVFDSSSLFYGHGTGNPQDESYSLVLTVLDIPFMDSDLHWNDKVQSNDLDRIIEIAVRRINERKPLPYLLGVAWFAGLEFYCDERALVPRSPFAELILNQFNPWVQIDSGFRILDLCTGNGCIGISSAVHLPDAIVDISDISPDALLLAARNIELHEVGDRVTALESDLFDALGDQKYDLIISNPPYVPEHSMERLPVEYTHEPSLGLHADNDGHDIVDRILHKAKQHLAEDGVLIVEVGEIAEEVHHRHSELPFIWLEFENGGEGVFLLHASDLD